MEKEEYKKLSERLVEQWQKEKVALNKGATEEELNNFENELKIELPKDFRYFYSLVNGMESCNSDGHCFELWSLNHILKKNEELFVYVTISKKEILIPFADWLIGSHRYYLVFDNFGNSRIFVDIVKLEKLTDTFTEFLRLYFSHPEKIHLYF